MRQRWEGAAATRPETACGSSLWPRHRERLLAHAPHEHRASTRHVLRRVDHRARDGIAANIGGKVALPSVRATIFRDRGHAHEDGFDVASPHGTPDDARPEAELPEQAQGAVELQGD